MRILTGILYLLALTLANATAAAPSFPTKPIRLVLGTMPGGGVDTVGRILAQKISGNVGQQVIVDNRGGANGIVGMEIVSHAAPDGYTIYMGTTGHISVNPSLYSKLPFDVDRDFVPLTQVVSVPFLLYAHPSLPAKTLGELVSQAKANPGKILWYSTGNGGLPHLAGEWLNLVTGISTTRVPYKGSAPGFNALLGGQVQLGIDAVPIGLQHLKTGRLRAIATTAHSRLPMLPEVPAIAETAPAFNEVVNWYGMLLPRGAAREVVTRLHAEIIRAMSAPEIRDKLIAQATDPVGSSPEQFAAFRKSEQARWGRVIKEANIQAD